MVVLDHSRGTQPRAEGACAVVARADRIPRCDRVDDGSAHKGTRPLGKGRRRRIGVRAHEDDFEEASGHVEHTLNRRLMLQDLEPSTERLPVDRRPRHILGALLRPGLEEHLGGHERRLVRCSFVRVEVPRDATDPAREAFWEEITPRTLDEINVLVCIVPVHAEILVV